MTFQIKSGNVFRPSIQACLQLFVGKKGADVGVIPTGCPPGYFRHLALCFENCRAGHHFDGGALCIGTCPGGFTTFPLTCTRWWPPKTTGRGVYAPHSITNFDAPCQDGYYKGGALCYRDCNRIQMANCGIGMCASDSQACSAGITNMVVGFLSGLGQAVGFVLSFGAGGAAMSAAKTAAKTGIKKLVSKVGGKAMQKGLKQIKKIAGNPSARKRMVDKVWKKVKEELKDKIKEEAQDHLQDICGHVANNLLDHAGDADTQSVDPKGFDTSQLDVIGVGEIQSKCTNPTSDNAKLDCAKSIMDTLSNVDPTGLMAMATAFMQPTCDI